jgi:hypothetical protein
VGRSRFVVRRLGTFGLGALVVGAILLGTGVAVSAQPASKAGAALAPNKKKSTTTTSTSSTTLPPTTTTQPCTGPASETVSGTSGGTGSVSVTMTPGSCLVSGTVVTITGTGFVDSSEGAVLECNASSTQPTVMYLGNAIPISCTNPTADIASTSKTGTFSTTFTIQEGVTGPPCGTCSGAPTDSTGGSTVSDAANYPCLPTDPAGTCNITYGDLGNDSVEIPLSFNPNIAPSPVATTTPTTAAGGTTATTVKPASKATTTKAATSALAFTGTGPGLWWLALVGMTLIVLGLLALALVDQPRRMLRLVRNRVSRHGPGSS